MERVSRVVTTVDLQILAESRALLPDAQVDPLLYACPSYDCGLRLNLRERR
jgi:hypothetical protein